jgi:hypothetical protein
VLTRVLTRQAISLACRQKEEGTDLASVDEHDMVGAVAHQVRVHNVVLDNAAANDDGA